YDQMIPAFLALEHYTGTSQDPTIRGTTGPMNIIQEPPNFLTSAYQQAAFNVAGLQAFPDINGRVEYGFFPEQSNILPISADTALRQSTSEVFLTTPGVVTPDGKPVGKRRLWIESNVLVNKIKFDTRRRRPCKPRA